MHCRAVNSFTSFVDHLIDIINSTGDLNKQQSWTLWSRREDVKRRRSSDVLWRIVPDTSSGDREGSIADGGESSSADNQ